jgi:UDP-N-acetyl-2-amino-2-deoxyglucuronate dehydrogenase
MFENSTLIKDRKIRIGVVGCGKIATNHFNSLAELIDQFELLCVCDNQPEALKKATSTLQVEGYSDIDSMLNSKPELDIITLCSPSGLHAAQTIQIAAQSKHVITEKPMAIRWSDGVEMVNACDKAKVKLFVVKQIRYQPALQLLKKAINHNRFGRIYLVNLNVFWTRPQTYYDQARWRGTWEFDGGAYMNQASHYVDLLDWLIGPVQSVQAMMATLAINMEAEDTGVVNVRWRSGALGSMSVTMLTYPKNLEASLTILGEKGSVKIGGLSANQIHHWEFSEPHELDETAEHLKVITDQKPPLWHKAYYENVAKTLRGEAHADIDGRAGLRSLEILIASYLSARDNKTINLPLVY